MICVRCLLRGFTEVGFDGLGGSGGAGLDVCFLWLTCCFLPWFMVFSLPVCCFWFGFDVVAFALVCIWLFVWL